MTNVENIMKQAQVFASAWSLVGGPFDSGDQLEQAQEEKERLQNLAESIALEQMAFGIIDPDYARIYTQARIIAWTYGYSCCAQGSFTRDLDLLLVPWAEGATKEIGEIVVRLADVCKLRIQGAPSEKPHGRQAWTLMLPGFGEVRWVDVSAFHAAAQPAKSAPWEPMKSAPKDGTTVLVLLDGSDIPHPVRWVDGWWQSSWDNHRFSYHDGPRAWMAIPDQPV